MELTTAGRGSARRSPATLAVAATSRRLLMVVCGCVAVLLLAPLASASALGGAIAGTVSDATTHAPIKGIEVCAVDYELLAEVEVEEEEEGHAFGCAKTDAHGHYQISELIPEEEEYVVVFEVPAGSKLNYIAQYFEGAVPPAEPTEVTVTLGKTTDGIDALLSPGAQISGRVTSAATRAPLGEVTVDALRPAGNTNEVVSTTHTGASGEYVLSGLPTGSYDVVFLSPGYTVQYYTDAAGEGEASPVAVTAPRLTAGIDGALSGGPFSPPPLRFLPSTSKPPTGRSGAGAGGAGPGTGTAGSSGLLTLLGTRIAVQRDGIALVKVACSASVECRGRIALRMARDVRVKGKLERRNLAVGKSSQLALAAGSRAVAKIKLAAAAVAALKGAHGRLGLELALSSAGVAHQARVLLAMQTRGGEQSLLRVAVRPLAASAALLEEVAAAGA